MALQMNYYHSQIGITIYNAYWRINPNNGIIGGKNCINYTIEVFNNEEMAHKDNFKAIKGFTFTFIPKLENNAPNFIIQAYNHAKSLSFFKGSVDV